MDTEANSSKQSLSALLKVKPPSKATYFVWSYVLNSDLTNETLDQDYGLVIFFGAYSTKEKADARSKEVIETTGHKFVHVTKPCVFARLISKPTENVQILLTDTKGKIIEYANQLDDQQSAEQKKRDEINAEIAKEREEETDPESFEYFRLQAVHAAFNYESIRFYEEKLEEAKDKYAERVNKAKAHYEKHPESETAFLPKLKEKLSKRDELGLYDKIESLWKSKIQHDVTYLPPLAKVLDPLTKKSSKEGSTTPLLKSSSKEEPEAEEEWTYSKGRGRGKTK